MDDVAAVDEVSAFPWRTSAENFFRMEESGGDSGTDVGGGVDRVGALGRDFPRERTMGLDEGWAGRQVIDALNADSAGPRSERCLPYA